MRNSSTPSGSASLHWLLVLFAGSGCAALIYEVVWFQLLQLIIGSSAISLGLVLGVYMGGLGLGSISLPRMIPWAKHHPLRVYACLEIGIGISGILVLTGIPIVSRMYVAGAAQGFAGILFRGIICALCLLPPTILMGGTLPAVSRWLETTRIGVSRLGFLYGANIAGAVFGAWSPAFTFSECSMSLLQRMRPSPSMRQWRRLHSFWHEVWNSGRRGLDRRWFRVSAGPRREQLLRNRVIRVVRAGCADCLDAAALADVGGDGLHIFDNSGGFPGWPGMRRGRRIVRRAPHLASTNRSRIIPGIGCSGCGVDRAHACRCPPLLAYRPMVVFESMVQLPSGRAASVRDHFSGYSAVGRKLSVGAGRHGFARAGSGGTFRRCLCRQHGRRNRRRMGFSIVLIPWIGTRQSQQWLIGLSALAAVILFSRWRSGLASVCAIAGACVLAWSVPDLPWRVAAYGHRIAPTLRAVQLYPGTATHLLYSGEGVSATIVIAESDTGQRSYHVSGKTEEQLRWKTCGSSACSPTSRR